MYCGQGCPSDQYQLCPHCAQRNLPAGFVIGLALCRFCAKSAVTIDVIAIDVAAVNVATDCRGSALSKT